MRPILTAAALSVALVSCAPTQDALSEGGQAYGDNQACFHPSTVVNFRADADTTAYVRAGRNEVYELQASGLCRGLSSARALAVATTVGSGARPCVGDFVGVRVSGPGLAGENDSQCRAQISRRLNEDEVAALPARLRP